MSPRRTPFLTVILFTAAWLAAGPAAMRAEAAAGDLDLSFHGTGWTIGPESFGGAENMAVQADGKLVLTGRARAVAGGLKHLAVWRLLPGGSPDVSFNGTGRALVTLSQNQPSGGVRVAVGADGRIVVAGYQAITSPVPGFQDMVENVLLARFLPDGRLDPAFGDQGQGWVLEHSPVMGAVPYLTLAVQPDGKILTSAEFPEIRRRLADGTVDTSFSSSTTMPAAGAGSTTTGLTVLSDGKILVTRASPTISVTRLQPDGTVDTSFGAGGTFNLPLPAQMTMQRGAQLTVIPDGKLVVSGSWSSRAVNPISNGFVAIRLLPGGTPDLTFGPAATPGHSLMMLNGVSADLIDARALAVQSDGGVLVAGTSTSQAGVPRAELLRWTAEGQPDATFGTGGRANLSFGGTMRESIAGLALLPGDKVFAAGVRNTDTAPFSAGEMLLARMTAPTRPKLELEYPEGQPVPSGTLVDFGPITSGTGLVEITLHNTGTATLTNLQAAITGESVPGDFHAGVPAGTSLAGGARTTVVVSLQPSAAPGVRTATLNVTAGNPGLAPQTISLTGSKGTPLQIWRVTWFGSPHDAGPGADANDFDGDGLPNFMEYATRSHPHLYSTGPCQPAGPGTFTYTRPSAALTEFSYTPESAPTPNGPWSAAGLTGTVLTDDGTVQTVQVVAPAGPLREFLRLRVTKL